MKKTIKAKGDQKKNDAVKAAVKKLFPTHQRHILFVFKDAKDGTEAAMSTNCTMQDMMGAHKTIENHIFENGGGIHMIMGALDGLMGSLAERSEKKGKPTKKKTAAKKAGKN